MALRDPNMVDLYETDPDLSTPDHTTTNSEPEVPLSHLAEQERAFSEDNVNDRTPDSRTSNSRMLAPVASISIDMTSIDGECELREAVVYREAAVDNSCVLHLREDGDRHRTGDEEDDDDDEQDEDDEEDEESFKECYPNMSNTLQWYMELAPW